MSDSNNQSSLTMSSDHEIVMSRVFNAPRELVFRAYTDPALIVQWWGPRNVTTVVDKMDVKAGGLWRYIQRDEKGNEYGFKGEYREVTPPERLVNTFEFEPMPGHIVVDTAVFEALPGGKTRVTVTSQFASKEDRDGMMNSGMEQGATESWDRLSELVATQAK
jgi:uncharacterized protein YndB with AHSA1/START domain